MRIFCAVVLSSCALLLAGCSGMPVATSTSAAHGVAFKGMVHGGQNPIVGAHVYLYGIAGNGYGGASTSLLTSAGNTTKDVGDNNYYVTTDSNGNFSITGDYTCGSPSHYYLYAVGGDSGSGANQVATLMASLGSCTLPNFASQFIVVNEVSTIATAYAFSGFAVSGTQISSPETAAAGKAVNYASFTVTNLETLNTGAALSTTPVANGGNGTVPQSEINTLANILAACVNTNGSISSGAPCNTLFANALSGGTTGTQPGDTATAAINIAHNPGANIAALYGLQTGSTPFVPNLSTQPNDFTIALSFTGGGIDGPQSLAVDGSGNVWVANGTNATVSQLNGGTGAAISSSSGYTAGGITAPVSVAIDPSGNAWVVNEEVETFNGVNFTVISPASVSELTSAGEGATGSPFTAGGLLSNNNYGNGVSPRDIAFDANGNAWTANVTGSVTELNGTNGEPISPETATTGFAACPATPNPSGVAVDSDGHVWVSGYLQAYVCEMNVSDGSQVGSSTSGVGTMQEPYSIAIDASNDLWLPNFYDSNVLAGVSVSKLTSLTAGSVFNPGGLSDPSGVAIDGAGNVWVASGIGDVVELNNSGAAISPSGGYKSSALGSAFDVAVDASGNVWVANLLVPVTYATAENVVEFVGAGTPVVTPLSIAVKNSTIGARP